MLHAATPLLLIKLAAVVTGACIGMRDCIFETPIMLSLFEQSLLLKSINSTLVVPSSTEPLVVCENHEIRHIQADIIHSGQSNSQ